MKRSYLFKPLRLFFAYFIAVSAVLIPIESYAIYEGVRDDIGYRGSGAANKYTCNTGTIEYNPFSANKDIDWEITNPICITFFITVGLVKETAGVVTDAACIPLNSFGLAQQVQERLADLGSQDLLPTLNPFTLLKSGSETAKCSSRLGNITAASTAQGVACGGPQAAALCAPAAAQTALATSDAIRCCSAYAAYLVAIGVALSVLAIIYGVAKTTYEKAKVCGNEWQQWTQEDGDWKKTKGPYRLCLEHTFLKANNGSTCDVDSTISLTNKYYREYIYGGIEYSDNGEGACENPWDDATRIQNLGYDDDKQKYYLTGAGAAPVYACQRFFVAGQNSETQAAYDCCKRRSQNAMCIYSENLGGTNKEYKFCEIGSRCNIGDVWFDVYGSKVEPNYACAKTYSVCPYNHLLAGGTETEEIDASDLTRTVNICQYMNHCVKLPILPYVYTSNMTGAFISAACKDMKGDSQNVYGYTSEVLPVNNRGFSAPMAQCFEETMENIFLNKAGDTKCLDGTTPGEGGECPGGYLYKEGETLSSKSFFLKIQDSVQDIIKMALTLSIVFFGYMILIGVPGTTITKKQLMPYVLKIGLMMYFAIGDGWQFGFMEGILGTADMLSEMTFKVHEGTESESLDGCQFPKFNYADDNEATKYNKYTSTTAADGTVTLVEYAAYPPGLEYLRMWDTLDCKLARAMGYGPEVSVPNLIFMILGGFLTGGLGIVFVIASCCFAFFMLSITVKALHIFLLSITTVIILLFVSPITITCCLFARTKGIFDGWWKQLLGLTLQPMILSVYLGIFLTLFDHIMVGDVTFEGDGKNEPKTVVCEGEAADTSFYCIFRVADIKTFPGLEILGIGLPMLTDMNETKLKAIINGAMLMFIFMKFMDQISAFAAKLVGGAQLDSNWGSATQMVSQSYGALRGLQKRGMGAIKKHGSTIARKAGEGATGAAQLMGNGGKHVSSPETSSGSDNTAGEGRGDDTSAASSSGSSESQSTESGKDSTSEAPKSDSVPEVPKGATDGAKAPEASKGSDNTASDSSGSSSAASGSTGEDASKKKDD